MSYIASLSNVTWPASMGNETFSALILGSFTPPYVAGPRRHDLSCIFLACYSKRALHHFPLSPDRSVSFFPLCLVALRV